MTPAESILLCGAGVVLLHFEVKADIRRRRRARERIFFDYAKALARAERDARLSKEAPGDRSSR